ncbi:MAG: Fic family protein [Synergistaceae bacterium]|nr:Fic family protein [Synergistaceae bacterium]
MENVVRAYNSVAEEVASSGACRADYERLMLDNRTILEGLNQKEGEEPGSIRTYSVHVGRYRGAPPEDCEHLLRRLFDWLGEDWGLGRTHAVAEGILKALVAHLYITWIHPFGDGNGRSARMTEFRLLMAAGVPLNAAHLLTTHYNDTRDEYYAALEESSAPREGNPMRFLSYAVQGFVDELDAHVSFIMKEACTS